VIRQWGKTMGSPGPIAVQVPGLGFTMTTKLPAGGGPILVNTAAHLATDLTHQRHTAGILAFSAVHTAVKIIHFGYKIVRHIATGTLSFPPIKRYPKKAATGAAIQTRGDIRNGVIRHTLIQLERDRDCRTDRYPAK